MPFAERRTKSHLEPMGRPVRSEASRLLMKQMGERLRWVREALGASQERLATQIGVHQTSWSLYERGLRWPDAFEIARITSKLRISRQYLEEGSLDGVDRDLAILLAADHPELARPKGKGPHTDMGPA